MALFKKNGNRYEIKFKRMGRQRKHSVEVNLYSKRALLQLEHDMNKAYDSGAWKLTKQSWRDFADNPGSKGAEYVKHEDGLTIISLLNDYLAEMRDQVMQLTYLGYSNKLKAFVRDNNLSEFSARATDDNLWTTLLEDYTTGKSRSYCAAYKSLISRFLAYIEHRTAHKLQLLIKPNYKMNKRYSENQTRLIKYLTYSQLQQVFSYINKRLAEPTYFYYVDSLPYNRETYGSILNAIYELMFFQCMRYIEFKRLKASHIDFTSNTIKLYGKGMKVRVVPISKSAKPALELLLKYSHTGVLNNSLKYARLHDKLKEALTDLSIMSGRMGLHVLRHGGATHWVNAGMPLKELSEFMGHESIAQTEVYAKVLATRLQDVVSRIG